MTTGCCEDQDDSIEVTSPITTANRSPAKGAPKEKETVWIDAWIRWERDSKDIVDDDEDDDVEEDIPAPTESFSFSYAVPRHDDAVGEEFNITDGNVIATNITLELKGFPAESEQIWNSTGLTVWPCSHHMCEYLVEHYRELLTHNGKSSNNILELGSGLGRVGILAYHLMHHCMTRTENSPDTVDQLTNGSAGRHIFLTDGDTDTLQQLRRNISDNNVSFDTQQREDNNSSSPSISCHQLLWGEQSAIQFCHRHGICHSRNDATWNGDGDPSNGANHHTSTTSSSATIGLILGSDLVYVPSVITPLFETVCALLPPPPPDDDDDTTDHNMGTFLMAHSNRRQGSSVTLEMILEGAANANMKHEILLEQEDIYVLKFRKKKQKS